MHERPAARVWLAFAVVMLIGVAIRLPGLGERTITHPEFYMPGIDLPREVHHPRPRTTLIGTLQSVYGRSDIHPPGFYVGALGWTHLFGTSEVALRLPSVLAGSATIALLLLLAGATDGPVVATAAGLGLALHGFHVSKSIQAELWVWPAFWAVFSVWLLRGLLERTDARRAFVYLAALSVGLWSEYSFWLFAAVQIAYVAVRACHSERVPTLLRLLTQAVVLALPVLLHLRKDLAHGSHAYLDLTPLGALRGILGFGNVDALAPFPRWLGSGPAATAAPWLLAALGLALLLLGLRVRGAQPAGPPPSDGFGARLWLPVAAVSALVLLAYPRIVPAGWKLALALALSGCLIAASWEAAARRAWPPLARVLQRVERAPLLGGLFSDIVICHGLGFVLALLVAGALTSMLAERVLLTATPFLLVLFARGWRVAGARGGPAVRWSLAALLASGLAFTSYDVQTRPLSSREYRAVALGLAPRVHPGDLVVTRYDWYSAPLYYYLRPDRYSLLRLQDFTPSLAARTQRAWLVVYGDPARDERPRAYQAAFEETLGAEFERFDGFTARGVRVIGYRRTRPRAAAPD